MTPSRTIQFGDSASATLIPWIGRCLEGLWLLTVVLVPVAFLDRDYLVSEAVIAYVEVPKVALLRTLAGLMAVLWLIEWGIHGRLPIALPSRDIWSLLLPGRWLPELKAWLQSQPTRWLILAVWFYFASTLLSTVLSGSFKVSLWGEVPGQDGYSAYNVISYVLLFAVIATHLKTRPQLWRLLGAIVVMGMVISGYAILQHYGHDFVNLTEGTGGGTRRVTSFMGNAIFAAAVMMMTVPITLVAASITLRDPSADQGQLAGRVKPWLVALAMTGLWGIVLSVQLLGLTFTFSRGPWGGAMVAILGFLCLTFVFVGWRFSLRAATLLALTMAFIIALLQWQGSISYLGDNPWLGLTSALLGLVWIGAVFSPWIRIGRFALSLGLTAALAVAVLLAVLWFKGDQGIADPAVHQPVPTADPVAAEVTQRLSSIKSEVQSGIVGGRTNHWEVSYRLIRERPWFDFDKLSLRWLRPLIGYGPDLYRFTYLLESPAEGRNQFPLEPDHAHNYFIHQTTEQGLLGTLSSVGIFAAVFIVGGHYLLHLKQRISTIHKLLIIGLMVTIAGRFLEMMVGVARVSDLTILWVILAVFVAIPAVMRPPQSSPPASSRQRNVHRRNPLFGRTSTGAGAYRWQRFWRLAVVAWLIGIISVVTWQKAINYPRAAVKVAEGTKYFGRGDFQTTLVALDRAIELAPDVPSYYDWRANIYLSYQFNEQVQPEQGCTNQNEHPYKVCLAVKAFENNLIGTSQRPFYYRSHMALARTASNLTLNDQAVQIYQTALSLMPASWIIRNELARAYIEAGQLQDGLRVLDESIEITGDSSHSSAATFLQGMAFRELGDLEVSDQLLRRSLGLGLSGDHERQTRKLLAAPLVERANAFSQLGQYPRAIQEWGQAIDLDPYSVESYINRGDIYRKLGQPGLAAEDYGRAIELDPQDALSFYKAGDAHKERGSVYYRTAISAYDQAIKLDPQYPMAYAARALVLIRMGQPEQAIADYDEAIRLDPQYPMAYAARALALIEMGRLEQATEDFYEAMRLDPATALLVMEKYLGIPGKDENSARLYFAQGMAYRELGELEKFVEALDHSLALSSTGDQARRIRNILGEYFANLGQLANAIYYYTEMVLVDSEDATAYVSRSKVYLELGQPLKATEDYFRAIELDPQNPSVAEVELQLPTSLSDLGQSQRQRGDFERAVKTYTGAIRLDPDNAFSYSHRGASYSQLEQHNSAIEDLAQAIRLNPKDGTAYMYRGISFSELGQYGQAIEDLNKAIRLDRQNVLSYAYRGSVFNELGQYDRAISDLDQAVRLNSRDPIAYYKRGLVYDSLEKFESAVENYGEAIRLDPQYSRAHYRRALAYEKLDEYERAIRDYRDATRLDPQHTQAYYRLARAHENLGQLEAALEIIARAVRLEPEIANYHAYSSKVRLELGLLDEALEDYYAAVRLERNNPVALSVRPQLLTAFINRGKADAKLSQSERAFKDFDSAIGLDPNDYRSYIERGKEYLVGNRIAKALDDYYSTIRYATIGIDLQILAATGFGRQLSTAFVDQADRFFQQGQHQEAFDGYHHALEVYPGNPAAFRSRGIAYNKLSKSSLYDNGYLWSRPTFSMTLNEGFFEAGGATYRVVIPHQLLSPSGEFVEITMRTMPRIANSTVYGVSVTDVFIGHAAAGGNPWDFDGNQVSVTWDGGGHAFSIPASSFKKSDLTAFPLDSDKDLIVAWDTDPNVYSHGFMFSRNVPGVELYSKRASQAAAEDSPNGLSTHYYGSGWLLGISDITTKLGRVDFTSTTVPTDVGDTPNNARIIWFNERAIEDYDEAIRLDPTNASTYLKRGLSYSEIGQHQQAIKDYSEAIRLDLLLADAYRNRATTYSRLGQYRLAAEDRAVALRLDRS